jgi:hypothetical protein
MKGLFMRVFDLTPDDCASDGHTSPPDNAFIRIEPRFDELLAEAVTILASRVRCQHPDRQTE